MSDRIAEVYDQIYSWKDYAGEARKLLRIIAGSKRSAGNRLLDVGCGTGLRMSFLQDAFDVTGIDVSPAMIREARKKNLRGRFYRRDMLDFDLKPRFDIVLCLFASISYLKTERELNRAIGNFRQHLNPGGVLLIEPFVGPDTFKPRRVPRVRVAESPEKSIVRVTAAKMRGRRAILDYHFLVSTDQGTRYFLDRHELTLFRKSTLLRCLRRHGFINVHATDDALMRGRCLYIAVKGEA